MRIGAFQLDWPLRRVSDETAEMNHERPAYWVTDDEVLTRFGPAVGRAILSVKDSVSRQKKTVERRWRRARSLLFGLSGAILFVSTVSTAFAGLTADSSETYIKILRVALPALLALLTGAEVLLDIRGRYVREAQAQLKLARLQSDIEYSLVWSEVPTGAGQLEPRLTIGTVEAWKQAVDGIMEAVSNEYISANSKSTERGTK